MVRQIEVYFSVARITEDETKFFTVVSALDGEILDCIQDTVLNPSDAVKYSTLKVKLIDAFSKSKESQI